MSFIEILFMLLFSSVKFAISIPVGIYQYNLNYIDNILLTSSGGICGVLISALLTNIILKIWNKYFAGKLLFIKAGARLKCFFPKKKQKRKFTRRNKMIINIRNKYGLIGISILTPLLLSIPIGTFIALRYYPKYIRTILYLCVSVFIWSIIFTGFWIILLQQGYHYNF